MERHGHLAGFAIIGTVQFRGGGSGEVLAHQRFVDNEPYRAARRGRLIVDKFASRRRFEGWAAWAQERIRVRGSSLSWVPGPFITAPPRFFHSRHLLILCVAPFPIAMPSQAVTGSKYFEQVCRGGVWIL